MKPGETLGRYEIQAQLARGGMAEVWLAVAKGVGGFEKKIVLKTILPEMAENPDFVRMFINEALLAARLNHPHIVQIFDLGNLDGRYFIAMEYVQGRTLRQISRRCRQRGTLVPPWFVLRTVAATCEALHYAHEYRDDQNGPLGLVHRDVTPENVMISFMGTVKILDFGLVKASVHASQTKAGILKGKYAYISPEQVRGAQADRRSDIYSLGVVLYEMLTGVRPFWGENDLDLLRKVTEGNPPPPRQLASWMPKELDAHIMKALSLDPNDRFVDASSLGDALIQILLDLKDHHNEREMGRVIYALFEGDPSIPTDVKKRLESTPVPEPDGDHPLISDAAILLCQANGTVDLESITSKQEREESESGFDTKRALHPELVQATAGDDERLADQSKAKTDTRRFLQRGDAKTFEITGLDGWLVEKEQREASAKEMIPLPGSMEPDAEAEIVVEKEKEKEKRRKWSWLRNLVGTRDKNRPARPEKSAEGAEPETSTWEDETVKVDLDPSDAKTGASRRKAKGRPAKLEARPKSGPVAKAASVQKAKAAKQHVAKLATVKPPAKPTGEKAKANKQPVARPPTMAKPTAIKPPKAQTAKTSPGDKKKVQQSAKQTTTIGHPKASPAKPRLAKAKTAGKKPRPSTDAGKAGAARSGAEAAPASTTPAKKSAAQPKKRGTWSLPKPATSRKPAPTPVSKKIDKPAEEAASPPPEGREVTQKAVNDKLDVDVIGTGDKIAALWESSIVAKAPSPVDLFDESSMGSAAGQAGHKMADLWEQAASLTRRIAHREEEPEDERVGIRAGHDDVVIDPPQEKGPAEPDLHSPAGFTTRAGPVEDSALPSKASIFDSRQPADDGGEDIFTSFKPVQLDQLQRDHPFVTEKPAPEPRQSPKLDQLERDHPFVMNPPASEPLSPGFGGMNERVEKESASEAARLFEEGLSLMREGKYDDAASRWERALSLDPDNRVYISNLKRLRKLMEPTSGKSPW